MTTRATPSRSLPTWAVLGVAGYAALLLLLGVRSLVPGWDGLLSPYGREFGAWSMYGDHAEVVDVTATIVGGELDGRALEADGIWHGDFVSAATPYLPQAVVDDYARFLHQRAGLGPDARVEVVVAYTVNAGPVIRVRGSAP